jgi:DNA-binding transcriptional LysR family regulator
VARGSCCEPAACDTRIDNDDLEVRGGNGVTARHLCLGVHARLVRNRMLVSQAKQASMHNFAGPCIAAKLQNGRAKVHNRFMFDWNDLKYLLAVDRCGSTLSAAKLLGLSQSTVRRRLEELERKAGRQLVRRVRSGYQLTELGAELSPLVERVEEAVAAIERHLSATEKDMVGNIRVTCPEGLGARLMRSALVDKFCARFPGLRVEFVMTEKLLDLAKGEADIAIRAAEPTAADGALFGRKIAEGPWALYASRSYVGRYGCLRSIEDINNHAVVRYDGAMSNSRAARWLRAVAPNARVAARGDTLAALIMAVKSGAAVAPLPVLVGQDEGDFVCVFGPIPELKYSFYLLMHKDLKRTPRVRAFFDFVVDEVDTVRRLLAGKPDGLENRSQIRSKPQRR